MGALDGVIALVAGASRGGGRGIACELGTAGATVYCTGRSIRGHSAMDGRPESITATAEEVTARGGNGIALQADHTDPHQVAAVIERIGYEAGRIDLLVNDIWGGDPLTDWSKPFGEHSLADGLLMQQRGLHTHIITAHYALPLLKRSQRGLLLEITDGDTLRYRGNLYYDLVKTSVMRLALGLAKELESTSVTALALTPGFLRSEAMLDHFGVREDNWRDAIAQDPHFVESETPFYLGRAVVALASDPDVRRFHGQSLATWTLSDVYGLVDVDGRQPHWGRYFAAQFPDAE